MCTSIANDHCHVDAQYAVLQCSVHTILAGEVPQCASAAKLLLAWAVQFNIQEVMWDFGLAGTQCAGPSVPALGYNGILPGPIINRVQCARCTSVQALLCATGTHVVHLPASCRTCACPALATTSLLCLGSFTD